MSEIRLLEADDRQRHRALMAHAFSRGRVPDASDSEPDDNGVSWGVFEAGALRAAYTLIDFQAHWGDSLLLPVGGIAGVATFAEARGMGQAGVLLRHSLERMREKGQVVSALYPFSWKFYQRYGWAWVGEKHALTVPLGELTATPEGRDVREIGHELHGDATAVREVLSPIYTAFARRYQGVFDAATRNWASVLDHHDGRTTYVYVHQAKGQEPDGYLLWRYNGDNSNGTVREFIANTPEAHRGLLSLLHYFATQCPKAEITHVPAEQPLWNYVMHWDLQTRAEPVFMGRVVDAPAALAALSPRSSSCVNGEIVIALTDKDAPWNQGRWRVVCEDGEIGCEVAAGAMPDLTCDITAFSQIFWGRPTLEVLRQAGGVETGQTSTVQWLQQLLAGPPVFCLDDF